MNYQEKAHTFANYGEEPSYSFSCLAEEAGEVLGKLNKFVRKQKVLMSDAVLAASTPYTEIEAELQDGLVKELGDLQWHLAECCTVLGITLEELQEYNISKLQGRVERGTIDGAGDER